MKNRLLVALIFIPLLTFIYLRGEYLFLLFTNIIVGVSLFEFYRMMKAGKREVSLELGVMAGMVASTLMYAYTKGAVYLKDYMVPGLVLLVGILLSKRVLQKKIQGSAEYVGNTMLGLLYIPLLFLHGYGIKELPHGGAWLLTMQILLWVSDSAAYFVGIKFGRKFFKNGLSEISPKKSYEGLIGSVLFTIVAMFVVKLVWFKDMEIALIHMIVIPLLVSIIGTVGDLAESMFKREFGVKDSGETLGEHGGILDRFDSMIFVLPTIFYYFKFIVL